jgi:hypothetical protein
MTPSTWMAEQIAMFGFAWIFGSVLVVAPIGALIGRSRGAEVGASSGLLLWGAGNLLTCVLMASYVQFDTVTVQASVTRCEPGTDSSGQATQQYFFAVQRPGEPAHELRLKPTAGLCPESQLPPFELRVRKDALASTVPVIRAEAGDDELPLVIMVTWGAFGGMAVLIGLLIASARAMGRPSRSKAVSASDQVGSVAAWRQGLCTLLSQLGGLLFLAAFIAPWFIDGSEARAIQLGLRCVTAALGCWLLAGIVAGTMTWIAAVFLLIFGGTFLGFAELARSGI